MILKNAAATFIQPAAEMAFTNEYFNYSFSYHSFFVCLFLYLLIYLSSYYISFYCKKSVCVCVCAFPVGFSSVRFSVHLFRSDLLFFYLAWFCPCA